MGSARRVDASRRTSMLLSFAGRFPIDARVDLVLAFVDQLYKHLTIGAGLGSGPTLCRTQFFLPTWTPFSHYGLMAAASSSSSPRMSVGLRVLFDEMARLTLHGADDAQRRAQVKPGHPCKEKESPPRMIWRAHDCPAIAIQPARQKKPFWLKALHPVPA